MKVITPLWLIYGYLRRISTLQYGLLTLLFLSFNAFAQGPGCPNVNAGDDIELGCDETCTDLIATFLQTGETTSYDVTTIPFEPPFPSTGGTPVSVNIDDIWSNEIPLLFEFCFFGVAYNEMLIGSNGVVTFDLISNTPGGFCNWMFSESIPDGNLFLTTIFGPYMDIDPSVAGSGQVNFTVFGDEPCRTMVINYPEIPYFSCNNLIMTTQIVIYETTNVVEVYLEQRSDQCGGWNSGNAVLGIQNQNGTQGFVAPGRNTGNWEAIEEAWRFTPNGNSNVEFAWLNEDNEIIGTDTTLNVCPDNKVTTYTAQAIYTNCNGDIVTVTDTVTITLPGSFTVDLGEDQAFCDLSSFEIIPELKGDIKNATYLWSTGETTPTITVSTTNIYILDVTVGVCTISDSISLIFLTSPDCTIPPICAATDFEENFGTGTGRVCDLNGATTTYICNQVSQVNDGEYSITNSSDGLNTGWHLGMEDHTEGDVDGRMFFVNADFDPGEFYRRTITLSSNIDYSFSAWITTVYDTDTNICTGTGIPSNIIFRIEDTGGVLIAETITGDIQNGPEPNWQEFFINFNTGVNTDIQLVLINNSIGGCGNDLAIDDITLSLDNSVPKLVTPQDMQVCDVDNDGIEIFDLESQIPEILDGQDPLEFNITFHTSQFDAEADKNAIPTPNTYQNLSNPETIFVRVEKILDTFCYNTVNFDLLLNEIIDLQVDLTSLFELCSTDTFPILNATPLNSGIDLNLVIYLWTDENGNIVSTEAIYIPTAAGIYTVVIDYPPCSQNTYVVEISVFEAPILDLGDDQILCEGGSFEIIPIINGNTSGITYLWSTGETTSSIIVNVSGTYDLQISVGLCVVTESIIIISEPLVVELENDFKICPNEPRTITAITDDTEVSFQWFLNEDIIKGETNSVLEIVLEGTELGVQTYTVIMNKEECFTSDDIDVTLYDIGNCVISQGISPNGSPGFNDVLNLEFLNDRTGISKLQIFNRLGVLVYKKNNYVKEWRGQSNDGNDLPTGTYFYVLDLLGVDPIYGSQATGWIYLNQGNN